MATVARRNEHINHHNSACHMTLPLRICIHFTTCRFVLKYLLAIERLMVLHKGCSRYTYVSIISAPFGCLIWFLFLMEMRPTHPIIKWQPIRQTFETNGWYVVARNEDMVVGWWWSEENQNEYQNLVFRLSWSFERRSINFFRKTSAAPTTTDNDEDEEDGKWGHNPPLLGPPRISIRKYAKNSGFSRLDLPLFAVMQQRS